MASSSSVVGGRIEVLVIGLERENALFLRLLARDTRGTAQERIERAERIMARQIGWAWGAEAHALAMTMVRELGMTASTAIEAANRGPVSFALSRVVV